MNRIIKFNFWTGKKMIHATEYADLLIKGDGRIFCWDDIDENTGISDVSSHGIIPLQFTGLTDKNGKEIYEGDILRHDFSPGRTEVIICQEENIIALIMKLRNYKRMNDLNDRFEVIGNIYENPELLKQ